MAYTPMLKTLKPGTWVECYHGGLCFTGQVLDSDFINGRDGCITIKDMEKNRVILPVNEGIRPVIRVLDYMPEEVARYIAKNSEKKGVLVKAISASQAPQEKKNAVALPAAESDDKMPAARLQKFKKRPALQRG